MDVILAIISFLLINYSVSIYMSMKAFEVIRQFDYERDKEIIVELGIKNLDNIDNEIIEKVEENRLKFVLSSILSAIILIVNLICTVTSGMYSYKQIFNCVLFLAVPSILMFLDKWLNLRELLKMRSIDYRNAVAQESERLAPIRIFFFISSIIIIIIVILIQEIYNLKSTNESYYNISFSVILIYLGGMGLISKIMFLKVPLKLDGKLQPYINSVVLGFGLYLLVSSLLSNL